MLASDLGALESHPFTGDLHADDAADRGMVGPQTSGRTDRRAMLGLFFGALVIAGLFTFVSGRIMHAVVFGG
jgi:uncharacterized membrane protein